MVRELTAGDVQAAAELVRRSWARSYADIVPPDEQPSAEEQASHLMPAGDRQGWVFDLDGQVAAVALVIGPHTDDPELSVLHVEPAAQGAGVGSQLHDEVLDQLRMLGRTRLHVWVYEANGQARTFYSARGWCEDAGGEKPERCGSAPGTRMSRVL